MMKTRLKEVRSTHRRASHVGIGIVTIHIISIIWSGGLEGDGGGAGVQVMMWHVRANVGMATTRGGRDGDNGWVNPDCARGEELG